MKISRLILLSLVLVSVSLIQCRTEKKITYDFPADYPEEVLKEATALFEQGKVLYKANCAECHGIYKKGKKGAPDFDKVELDNYSARFLGRDPKNHAIVRKVTSQQLNAIVVFLSHKKKEK